MAIQVLNVESWNISQKLSENFTVGEMINSQTAIRQRILMQYVSQAEILGNMKLLANNVLQPARNQFKDSMFITSGYRSFQLNQAVGGAQNSLHLKGLAADIMVNSGRARLIEILKNMDLHELIIYPNFVHVSWKEIWRENKYIIKNNPASAYK